jgi:DNA-binding NarL/FixJ family response regulator
MTVEPDSLTRLSNKILIVDDHPFIIQGYKNGITRYQPEKYEFHSGSQRLWVSLHLIVNPETAFDIAFLDISMPSYEKEFIQEKT